MGGKHKGEIVDDVPTDYLLWILGNVTDLAPAGRVLVEGVLRDRGVSGHHRPPPPPPPSPTARGELPRELHPAMMAIAKAGRRALAAKYHPDVGGDTEQMKQVNMVCDWIEAKYK